MKYIKPYNESVKDYLKPKNEEEIRKSIEGLSPKEQMNKACKFGLYWLVKELIDKGYNVKANIFKTSDMMTNVIKNNNLDILKLLVENGFPTDDLYYYVSIAIQKNNTEMVKYFIEKDVQLWNEEEDTNNIEFAIENCNPEMVKLILDNGGSPYVEDGWLNAALTNEKYIDAFKAFIEKDSDFKNQIIRIKQKCDKLHNNLNKIL